MSALGIITLLVAVLDSNSFTASSILGARKPDERLPVRRKLCTGIYTKPRLPVTAKGVCFISVTGRLKNELSIM